MRDKKAEAFYQVDHFCTDIKAVSELQNFRSMLDKVFMSWLSKLLLWKDHMQSF